MRLSITSAARLGTLALLSTSLGCMTPAAPPAADMDLEGWGRADEAGELAEGAVLRLRAVGDVMMGTDFPSEGYLPPEDGADLFADVSEWLEDATLTFANLEGPLCDGGSTDKCGESTSNCYAFRTPTRYGQYLQEAGVDVASIANNHALDFGDSCRSETEATLDELGIAYSGRPGSVATLERGGLRIGVVAFHTAPHSNYLLDYDGAVDLVRAADQDHDLVVVSFHGGAEGESALHTPDGTEYFYGSNRGDLRRFAHSVIDAGADLVLGHGPHVPRAMEVYEGRLVAYSLGNFATYGRFSLRGNKGISLVLEAQLDADGRFVSGSILPVRLVDGGFPVQDEGAEVIPLVRELSQADFPETGVLVGEDGTLLPRTATNDDL